MIKNYYKLIVALLFATSVFGQNLPSYLPKDGLVGWWPFNGNARDESYNKNDGKIDGASLTEDRNGNLNSAYLFDNPNDVINVNYDPNNNTLDLNDEMTFSFWFKSTNVNSHQVIMNKATGGTSDSWIVQLSATPENQFKQSILLYHLKEQPTIGRMII